MVQSEWNENNCNDITIRNLKVFFCNVRSIRNKFKDFILPDILEEEYDILAYAESWLNCSHRDFISEYSVPGYDIFFKERVNKRGGGVLCYVKKSVGAIQLMTENIEGIEHIHLLLSNNMHNNLALGIYYRPPSSSPESDESIFNEIQNLANKYETIILGDFNLTCNNWGGPLLCNGGKELYENLLQSEFDQMINEPTRENNLLDLLLVTDSNIINNIGVEEGYSDHRSVVFDFHFEISRDVEDIVEFKNFNRIDVDSSRAFLSDINWENLLLSLNCVNANSILNQYLINAQTNFTPTVKGVRKLNTKPEWLDTQAVKDASKQKRKAYRKLKRNGTPENLHLFREKRRMAALEVRKSRIQYEDQLTDHMINNPKFFFRYCNKSKITKDSIVKLNNRSGEIIYDDYEIAKELNDYFTSVFTIEDEFNWRLEPVPLDKSLNEFSITKEEVKKAMQKLNPNKACGPDEINVKFIKANIEELVEPLCVVFNKSLDEGVVPEMWKCANVTPVFKKGDRMKACNYRPISLTSILVKLLEGIIKTRIVEHLHINSIINPSQHGFMKKKSCITNLLEFYDRVVFDVELFKAIDIIFLDFMKAFDKVAFKRLIAKLRMYGIEGKVLDWIVDWLKDRKQRVVINGKCSSWSDVTSGVPQGSVLGPLLFLIYINDLDDNIQAIISKFADDTKIMFPVTNQEDANVLQQDLDRLIEWAEKWMMSFNKDKCKVLHLGSRNLKLTYNLGGDLLSDTDVEKDLGIYITNKLKSDYHINEICKKANKILGMIGRALDFKTWGNMVRLFNSLVRPHLEYGSQYWNPHYKKDIAKIEKVQKRFTRMIPGLSMLSYEERLSKLGMISLEERRRRLDLVLLYKMIFKYVDIDIENYIEFSNNSTRGHNLKIKKRKFYTDLGKFTFFNRVVDDWNELPFETVNADSLELFKKKIMMNDIR